MCCLMRKTPTSEFLSAQVILTHPDCERGSIVSLGLLQGIKTTNIPCAAGSADQDYCTDQIPCYS